MTKDIIIQSLREKLGEYVQQVTTTSRTKGMWICPLCGSGTGKSKTGAFSIDPATNYTAWKCFACDTGGDIFDLIGAVENLPTFPQRLERACSIFGISMEETPRTATHPKRERKPIAPEPEQDYTAFFLQAHDNITATDYPSQRGLSAEIVNRFKLGYVAEWRHPKASDRVQATPRLIIPTSKHSYIARDTRQDMPREQQAYKKMKVGQAGIFNAKALQTAMQPVYLVEGELDALSIMDVGGQAVALGSVAMVRKFLDHIKTAQPVQPLIIALDNDAAGEDAQKRLKEGLEALQVAFWVFNPAEGYKDANEALQADRAALQSAVAYGVQLKEAKEQQEREAYLGTASAHYVGKFLDAMERNSRTEALSTGYKNLDLFLDGGLYEGLYIVGAISSLGKTTWLLQMADQMAQAGQDVLIFSLEMSRYELMAKSISRLTYQLAANRGLDVERVPKTTRSIQMGRWHDAPQVDKQIVSHAIATYRANMGQHLFILEGMGNIGAAQVREAVETHKKMTGAAPVVIIDYLQLLAPSDPRMTDKQNTDNAVMELKRISRDYQTPVIGISSFNRANYSTAVSMEAFKESGAIEYSSDVLMGLQLKGSGNKDFDVNTAKSKTPREVELVILKNRNGAITAKNGMLFAYDPRYNVYMEK